MAELTDKESAFVRAYCSDAKFNGAEAARLAGYAEASARITASKLLTKANVQDAIQDFMNKATKKALVTTEMLVEKLLNESEYYGEGASHSARIAAVKVLTDYTGGFDKNKQSIDHTSSDQSMTPKTTIAVTEETLNDLLSKI